MKPPPALWLTSHSVRARVHRAVRRVVELCRDAGRPVIAQHAEIAKHGLTGLVREADDHDVPCPDDVLAVLGGDGTILSALRIGPATTPVFGINSGGVGFLSAAETDRLDDAIEHVIAGTFSTVSVAALEADVGETRRVAVNDIVMRSAASNSPLAVELLVDGGRGVAVACDGVLVSTPIGSSGYNLSAGGPLCSWRSAVFVVTALRHDRSRSAASSSERTTGSRFGWPRTVPPAWSRPTAPPLRG